MLHPLKKWRLRQSRGGSVDHGNRAVTELEYEPSTLGDHGGDDGVPDLPFNRWVVSAIRKTDGLCSPLTAIDTFDRLQNPCIEKGHESVRLFEYSGGMFDTSERLFTGFKMARETDMDGNVIETTHSLAPGSAGKAIRRDVYAGPHLLRRTVWNWVVGNPQGGASGRSQVYLSNSSTVDFAVSVGGPPELDVCGITINDQVDAYGRVTRTCSRECTVDPTSGNLVGSYSCTQAVNGMETVSTIWANPIDDSHVRERPQQIELTGHRNGSDELISRTQFRYDGASEGQPLALGQVGQGLIREKSEYLDESSTNFTPGWIVTEKRNYDAFGNAVRIENAHGHFVTDTYDPDLFSLHKTSSAYVNAVGVNFLTTYQVDLRFGKATSTTDANNDRHEFHYDSLGRTVCEAQPGDTVTGCLAGGAFNSTITRTFHYAIPGSTDFELSHNRVVERVVEPNNPADGYLETVTFVDGLGRPRFRKVQKVLGNSSPTVLTAIIEGQTKFDAEGRAVLQYTPYASPAVENPTTSAIATSYGPLNGLMSGVKDPFGRPRVVDPPGPTSTTYFYEGRRRRTVNAAGGEVQDYYDWNQRAYVTLRLLGGSVDSIFARQFDAAGRIVRTMISGDSSTLSTHDFDSLGRRVRSNDPDAGGTWEFGYDYVGNRIFTNDPKPSQHTQTVFDDQSRPVRICSYGADSFVANTHGGSCGTGGSTQTVNTYDAVGSNTNNLRGRLAIVSDFAGSATAYSTITYGYDDLGRKKSETYSVDGHLQWANYYYDRAGHVTSIDYGLGENARYSYNAAGQPIGLIALNASSQPISDHVDDIDYDVFGRIQKIQYANGVVESKAYHDEAQGFSLSGILTEKADGTDHLSLSYGYNSLGKIANIDDLRNTSGPLMRSADYAYDALGRLTGVTGSNVDSQYRFDDIGNLIEKDGDVLEYNVVSGTAGAHHVDSFGSLLVTYDENGNRSSKDRLEGGDQTYTYDRFNRLVRIDQSGPGSEVVHFKYSATGRKVTKQTGTAPATRYFGDLFEESLVPRAGGGYDSILAKHFFIAGMRVSSTSQDYGYSTGQSFPASPIHVPKEIVYALALIATGLILGSTGRARREDYRTPVRVRLLARVTGGALLLVWIQLPLGVFLPSEARAGGGGPAIPVATVHYYHGDHLGSTHVVTNDSGNAIAQIRYDAYGKEVLRADGTGSPLEPTEKIKHGFTGHERDHATGLIDAGARFLDAELAQFATGDPAGQYTSPYAYGPGDPVNGTDPSGAIFEAIFAVIAILMIDLGVVQLTMAINAGGSTAAIVGALMTIAGGAFGFYIAPASAGVSIVSFEGAFAGSGAVLSSYSIAQQARGRAVHWAIGVAQTALSLLSLAYAWGKSNSANGSLMDPAGPEGRSLSVPEEMYARYRFQEAIVSGEYPAGGVYTPLEATEATGKTLTRLYDEFGVEFAVDATRVGSPTPPLAQEYRLGTDLRVGSPSGVTPGSYWDAAIHVHGPGSRLLSLSPGDVATLDQLKLEFVGMVSRSDAKTFFVGTCSQSCVARADATYKNGWPVNSSIAPEFFKMGR